MLLVTLAPALAGRLRVFVAVFRGAFVACEPAFKLCVLGFEESDFGCEGFNFFFFWWRKFPQNLIPCLFFY